MLRKGTRDIATEIAHGLANRDYLATNHHHQTSNGHLNGQSNTNHAPLLSTQSATMKPTTPPSQQQQSQSQRPQRVPSDDSAGAGTTTTTNTTNNNSRPLSAKLSSRPPVGGR